MPPSETRFTIPFFFTQGPAMKKSLIALAALAAVSAASAQSSVTLYGIADIWVGKVKGGKVMAASGGVNTSRWGVKGSEDLGGGLKANFNFESGLDLANGAVKGGLFERQANVGVSGGFGTVKLGKSWNALDDMFGAANSGFDSALSANGVWLNGYTGTAAAQLYYATPDMNGFNAAVSTQLNGNSNNGASRVSAFNVTYTAGPIYAGLGYEEDKGTGQKGTMINGSYDLGKAKLLASVYNTKPTGAGVKVNSYQIGADVPLSSAMTLSVGYAASKPNGGQTNSAFGVAAAYSLSQRTTVYAGIRAESVKASNGQPDRDVYAVGINHKF
jgi:predicted porin